MKRKAFVLYAALSVFVSCNSGERPFQVIVGARLTDPPIENSVIIIKDGLISAVGPQQTVPIPADSTKTNGLGKTIESHAKLAVGAPADLVLLDENHRVLKTMRAGKWVGDQQ